MPIKQLNTDVELRPFPHPYRAALAICSDIDNCSWKTFKDVHRFINDPKRGLGLPVADSFFAWGREPEHLAFFLPDGKTRSPEAEWILQAIESGLIDSIHSWGDFHGAAPDPEFLTGLARRMTRELSSRNLQIKVWINHGDKYNRQNFLARLQPDYSGDDPASPYFTCDWADTLGVKFYWWSEVVSRSLSDYRPDRFSRFRDVYALNTLRNLAKMLVGRRNKVIRNKYLIDLAHPVSLRNGRVYFAFTRFNVHPKGPWGQPTRYTLRYTFTDRVLEELEAREGYVLVYAHLGQPHGKGVELFPEADRSALSKLSEFYHDGRIWVAPTVRLLNHWLMRQTLEWQAMEDGDRIFIDITAVDDPTTGRRVPEPDELAGLCFYTPRPEITTIRLTGKELPHRTYGRDRSGQASVGFDPIDPPNLDVLEN